MKNSKSLWRALLFFVLIAALCGSFALPVENIRVSAAVQAQAAFCSTTTPIAKWTFEGSDITTPSTGTGTFSWGALLNGPSTIPGPAGSSDAAVNFNTWPKDYTEGGNIEIDSSTQNRHFIGLTFDYSSTADGPKTIDLYYSMSGTPFQKFGQSISISNDAKWHTEQIDLSTVVDLNNSPDVKFKIYGYGSNNDLGTLGFDNIVLCTIPVVLIDNVAPNPTNAGTTVTWHALVNGTYDVRVGGTSCVNGKSVETKPYDTSPQSVAVPITNNNLVEGTNSIRICVKDPSNITDFAIVSVVKNTSPPTVTVDRANGQSATTSSLPINYSVIFSEPINVSTFDVTDIAQTGTASGITWKIINSGDNTKFTLQATAVAKAGTIAPFIPADKVTDIAGNNNTASTTIDKDNIVAYGTQGLPPAVLINEVAWSGTAASGNDEWIELYNPGSLPVDITGWQLYGDDNKSGTVGSPDIDLKGTIPANGYFLLERGDNQTVSDVTANQVYTGGDLLDTGERLYLKDNSNPRKTIDTANVDGGAWPAGTKTSTTTAFPSYASMERVGTTGNQWVTYQGSIPDAHNRNGGDIKGTPGFPNWISTASVTTITSDLPDPSLVNQYVTVRFTVVGGLTTPTGTVTVTGTNASSSCTYTLTASSAGTGSCTLKFTSTGTKTITATYHSTSGLPASNDTESHVVSTTYSYKTPTPVPPPPPQLVVINEFVPRPGSDWNHDGVVNTGDEFIELLNHGTVDVNLSGWRLDDEVNVGSNPYSLPAKTIKPGERIVFFGSDTGLHLDDGGDAVRLLKPNGQLIDAYNYTIARYPDESFCRLPDNGGADDWNQFCFPTPGIQNSLSGNFVAPPTNGFEQPSCIVSDTLPAGFVQAECDPFGNNIWSPEFWDRTGWYDEKDLPSIDGKHPVFAD